MRTRLHSFSNGKSNGRKGCVEQRLLAVIAMVTLVFCNTSCNSMPGNRVLWVCEAPRKMRWSVKGIATTPIIRGDTIIYMGGYAMKDQVFLHAVDARTGKRKWSSKDPISQFLVGSDRVFVLSRPDFFKTNPYMHRTGSLEAISIADGKVLWKAGTQSDFQNPQMLSVGKYIYCLTNKQTLTGVDQDTGKVAWELQQPDFQSNASSSSTIAEGDNIYAEMPDHSIRWMNGKAQRLENTLVLSTAPMLQQHLSLSNNILLIPASDGTLVIANFAKRSVTDSLPVGVVTGLLQAKDETLFFGSMQDENQLAKQTQKDPGGTKSETNTKPGSGADTKDGTNDSSDTKGGAANGPLVNQPDKNSPPDNNIAPAREKQEAKPALAPFMCALNMESKNWIWRTKLAGRQAGLPVIAGDLLLIATSGMDESLIALDIKTGKELWKNNCGPLSGEPVFDRGVIYANGKDQLNAIDSRTGETLWSVKPRQYGPSGSPVIQGDVLYMTADDSNLYAVKLTPPPDSTITKRTSSSNQMLR